VCAEGKLLDSDHQLCGDARFSKKAGRACGALEAENLFEIENAREIHRVANVILRYPARPSRGYGAVSYAFVQAAELASAQVQFKPGDFCVSFHQQPKHSLLPSAGRTAPFQAAAVA
jgi:hypothetical protein